MRDRLCEGRLSSTVLCEHRGEIPLSDPIMFSQRTAGKDIIVSWAYQFQYDTYNKLTLCINEIGYGGFLSAVQGKSYLQRQTSNTIN